MLRYDDIDHFNETTQGESSDVRFKKRTNLTTFRKVLLTQTIVVAYVIIY